MNSRYSNQKQSSCPLSEIGITKQKPDSIDAGYIIILVCTTVIIIS